MKCMVCGAEIPEGATFCSKCGAKVAAESENSTVNQGSASATEYTYIQTAQNNLGGAQQPNPFNPPRKGKSGKGKVFHIIGMISGIVSVLFGIVMNTMSTGVYTSHEIYGGDAYTGIQNAAADAANNISTLTEVAVVGFAFLLIALGLAIFCYFGSKLMEKK